MKAGARETRNERRRRVYASQAGLPGEQRSAKRARLKASRSKVMPPGKHQHLMEDCGNTGCRRCHP